MKVSIYLTFDGNCAEAFDFYKNVFSTDLECKMTWSENSEKTKAKTELSEEDGKKIMHTSLALTKDTSLMGCDNPPEGQGCGENDMGHEKCTVGNNMQINLTPDSKKHADSLLKALSSEGGHVIMPMAPTFWGDYFGMCKDRFGLTWMLGYPLEGEPKETKENN